MRLSILVFLLIKRSDQGVPFYEGYPDREVVLSCVNRIVKRHFDSKHQVTILAQGSKDYVKGMESTVRLIANVSKLDKMSWFPQTKQAVVFLDGDFHRDLNVLMSLGTIHPRSRFLIVCTIGDTSLSAKSYLTKVIQYLHQNERWTIAIAVKRIGLGNLHLYGYTKTAYENCGKPTILSFGKCSEEESLSRLYSTTNNYNHCPLRLATFSWPPLTKFYLENRQRKATGIESNLVNAIVERLNASALFLDAAPSEMREIVSNHNADIGFGQLAMYDGNEYLYTKSYSSVQGLILVPRHSSANHSILSNLTPFSATVWIAVILVLIFVMILRVILPVFKVISVLHIWALLMGLSAQTRPTRLSQRTYFISLILFANVIRQAYLANLTMTSTKAADTNEIGSLDELEESKNPFGGAQSSVKLFATRTPRLHREYKVMNWIEFHDNLLRLKTGRQGIATYVEVSKYVNYNHWKRTILLPEVLTWYPVALILPSVSTIVSTCDWTITAVVEAGLMDTWANVMNRKNISEDAMAEQTDDHKHVDLEQFLIIFRLLVMALGLCTVVFMIELLVEFCRRKRYCV